MKASKLLSNLLRLRVHHGLALVLLAVGIYSAITSIRIAAVDYYPTYTNLDLRLRYDECACAHTGVNPFHVWNHDVVSENFRGLDRPDLETDSDATKRSVHNYPPWHMAYTWFYAKLPFHYLASWFFFVSGMCFVGLLFYLKHHFPPSDRLFAVSLFVFEWANAIVWCQALGNYGILVGSLLVPLIWLVQKGHQVGAGIVWGLMMVKPQIAVLLFFPLLFQRKYVTIAVAVLQCVLATCWTASVYGESPIALLLQIPASGAPYRLSVYFIRVTLETLGISSAFPHVVWSVLCAAACGWFSWRLRRCPNAVFRFAPAAFFFLYWTYANDTDSVATWPFLLAELSVFLSVFCRRGWSWGKVLLTGYFIVRILSLKSEKILRLLGAYSSANEAIASAMVNFLTFSVGVSVLILLVRRIPSPAEQGGMRL